MIVRPHHSVIGAFEASTSSRIGPPSLRNPWRKPPASRTRLSGSPAASSAAAVASKSGVTATTWSMPIAVFGWVLQAGTRRRGAGSSSRPSGRLADSVDRHCYPRCAEDNAHARQQHGAGDDFESERRPALRPVGDRHGTEGRRHRPASSRERVNTSSIIGSVSLPVNVFCWLG